MPSMLPNNFWPNLPQRSSQPTNDHNLALVEQLKTEIAQAFQQRITFAQYMDWVLYHPQIGYYPSRASQMGKAGDFFTSVHLGADFAELLAVQFTEFWTILGRPAEFTLVEMGAGQGLLAADILGYLQTQEPNFFAALTYVIVEKVPELIATQQQQLTAWAERVRWCGLTEIPRDSVTGCFFSNELLDALPVHQVVIDQGQLREVYVQVQSDPAEVNNAPFQEAWGKLSKSELATYFEQVDVPLSDYPQGYQTEINLQALDWLKSVTERLQRGYLLTIDYGYLRSQQYYNPVRSQGTLKCYFQHSSNADPYSNIGKQDITAHVDFGSLIRQGSGLGLHNLGITQQGLFLMNLGLGERLSQNNAVPSGDVMATLQRRDALHQLINPHGLGGFQVLLQSKGLTANEQAQPILGLIEAGLAGLASIREID